MESKVISLTPNTIHWSKAMEACNNADKMVSLINKQLAREELKRLMAKMVKND